MHEILVHFLYFKMYFFGIKGAYAPQIKIVFFFFVARQSGNAAGKWEDWQHAQQSVQKSK
jgi:hypothetical protein